MLHESLCVHRGPIKHFLDLQHSLILHDGCEEKTCPHRAQQIQQSPIKVDFGDGLGIFIEVSQEKQSALLV